MNQMVVNFALRPLNLNMPTTLQTIVLWVCGFLLVVEAIVAVRMCIKYKTATPIIFIVAGFVTSLLDPFPDFLGHGVHPNVGQIVAYESLDRLIPWHVVLIYGFYFPAFYLALFSRAVENRLTGAFLWKAYFLTVLGAYVFEAIPVSYGLWAYYGYQPLWPWKGTMPITFAFVNAACIVVPAVLIYRFNVSMTGWKQIKIIPLSVLGAAAGNMGAGFPFYFAVNTTMGPLALETAGVVTVLSAIFIVWVFIEIYQKEWKGQQISV